jgi:outer membrane cobalamin receptor
MNDFSSVYQQIGPLFKGFPPFEPAIAVDLTDMTLTLTDIEHPFPGSFTKRSGGCDQNHSTRPAQFRPRLYKEFHQAAEAVLLTFFVMIRYPISSLLIALAPALPLSAPLAAQTIPVIEDMPPVVVVAAPIIEGNTIDDYSSGITVVTEQQLKLLNAQDMGTALRLTPGVNISRYNQVGSHGGSEGGAVFIRGMGASRPGSEIKTYIDGVPMYMGLWNHPLLDLLSIDSASAIEIYKSPQPHRFGNAFAAVNIIPKRREFEGFESRVHVAAGSYNTFVQKAEHGGKVGPTDYYLGQSFRSSDGHRTRSSGEMQNYFARVGQELNENWYVSIFGLHSRNHGWDPGAQGAPPEERDGKYATEATLGSIRLEHAYDTFSGNIRLYHNHGRGRQLSRPDGTPDATWKFHHYGLGVREDFETWPGGSARVGLDHDITEAESGHEDPAWEGLRRRITSPYFALSQFIGDEEGFYLVPSKGFRHYDHNRFRSESAPHAGLKLGYVNTELHVGYSRGVLYPGLEVERILGINNTTWRNLHAETLDHYEAGIRHIWRQAAVDLVFFRDEGQNRYVLSPPPPGPPQELENIGSYRTSGVESTVRYAPINSLSLFAGATFLRSDPDELPYTPESTLTAGLNWRFLPKAMLSLDAQRVSGMYTGPRARRAGVLNADRVDSYYLINGRISYTVNFVPGKLEGEIFLAGENLTDQRYEYRPDYPMPGINGMLGVDLRF